MSRFNYNVDTLGEHYKKEMKYFQPVKEYFGSAKQVPITGKFYARHEALDMSQINMKFFELSDNLEKTPKQKYSYPITENQNYGWFTEPLVPLMKHDPRFYFPIRYSKDTEIGMKLAKLKSDRAKMK